MKVYGTLLGVWEGSSSGEINEGLGKEFICRDGTSLGKNSG